MHLTGGRCFLVFVLLSISSASSSSLSSEEIYKISKYEYMNVQQWQCGSGNFDKWVADLLISKSCWDQMLDFNMCCAIHDDCYQVRRGQENCDAKFCDCLNELWTNRFSNCFNGVYTKGFCFALFFGGKDAYEKPADVIDTNFPYTPALNITAKKYYKKLYKQCSNITRTLSNCAYNHNVCHLKMLTDQDGMRYEDCLDKLIGCLDDSSLQLADPYSTCRKHVEEAIFAISHDYIESAIEVLRKAKKMKKVYFRGVPPVYLPAETQ